MKVQTIQAIRGLLTSQQCTFTGNQFGVLASILSELNQEEQTLCTPQAAQANSGEPRPHIRGGLSRSKSSLA